MLVGHTHILHNEFTDISSVEGGGGGEREIQTITI